MSDPYAVKYTKHELIDSGTYARVYKVLNRNEDKFYACKLHSINKDTNRRGLTSDIIREILTLNALNSPYIIKYKEIVASDKYIGIILPMCDGTLHNITHLNHQQKQDLTVQLLLALVEMTNKNIVHRDIKSNNILYNKDGDKINIYLADFGMAKLAGEKLDLVHSAYEFTFQAPELLLGKSNYGAEIDIWAAGIVLLSLFTGYNLIFGPNPVSNYLYLLECFTRTEQRLKIIKEPQYIELLCRHPGLLKRFVDTKSNNILKSLYNKRMLTQNQYQLLKAMLQFLPQRRPDPTALLQQFCLEDLDDYILPKYEYSNYKFGPVNNLALYDWLYSFSSRTDNIYILPSAIMLLNHCETQHADKFKTISTEQLKVYVLCIFNIAFKLYSNTSFSILSILCSKCDILPAVVEALEIEIMFNIPNFLLNNVTHMILQLNKEPENNIFSILNTIDMLLLSGQAQQYTLYELVNTVLYHKTGKKEYKCCFSPNRILTASKFFEANIKALSNCRNYYKYAKLCQSSLL